MDTSDSLAPGCSGASRPVTLRSQRVYAALYVRCVLEVLETSKNILVMAMSGSHLGLPLSSLWSQPID